MFSGLSALPSSLVLTSFLLFSSRNNPGFKPLYAQEASLGHPGCVKAEVYLGGCF